MTQAVQMVPRHSNFVVRKTSRIQHACNPYRFANETFSMSKDFESLILPLIRDEQISVDESYLMYAYVIHPESLSYMEQGLPDGYVFSDVSKLFCLISGMMQEQMRPASPNYVNAVECEDRVYRNKDPLGVRTGERSVFHVCLDGRGLCKITLYMSWNGWMAYAHTNIGQYAVGSRVFSAVHFGWNHELDLVGSVAELYRNS